MIVITVVPVPVIVIKTTLLVVAMLDVDGVAVLTEAMLGTVGCHRCWIGMHRIMRAGRIGRWICPAGSGA